MTHLPGDTKVALANAVVLADDTNVICAQMRVFWSIKLELREER